MAIVPRGLPQAEARAPRPHLRDSGHLALGRAGKVRVDAQEVPDAARGKPDGPAADGLAGARGGSAVEMEDYCHSFEHTVELQLIFLQHVLGPDVRILPICAGLSRAAFRQAGGPRMTTR
jgi:predicted class III extradiol MEMO1 family dioxygenase